MKIITNYVELGIRVIKDSDNDCISKLHVDTCKHMQDVLRNRE